MNKTDLIHKIKALDGLNQDERAYLIDLVNTKKKYGLVWEDKPEAVEEQLREQLPVLKEVKERAIVNGEEHPNHILIEGDNLHALTALSFTHEGKFDLIYIDPPYNTGNTDFRYNDKYVDKEDSFRHSKWLSFMSKRLKIAKKLLNETGLLCINIDDNEISQLSILCDEIFNTSSDPNRSNKIATLVWDLGTGTSAGHFTRTHEYILVYAKSKASVPNFSGGTGIIDDRAIKKISMKNSASPFTFPKGTRIEAPDGTEFSGSWGGAETTTLVSGRMIAEHGMLKEDVTLSAGWTQKKQMESYFNGESTIDSKGQKVLEFYFRENGKIYCRKDRSKINPPSVLRDVATTKQGSALLKDIFMGEEPITFVKPIQLITYFLELLPQNIQILDFFAGSGTTLHATMEMNSEGGNRTCVLVTSNENNICEEVTYERNKRVIQGYINAKGEQVEGLKSNNLRYYKSDFVSREPSLQNKRELTKLATELLCIKEDIYNELTELHAVKLQPAQLRCFHKGDLYLLIIYNDAMIDQMVELIKAHVSLEGNENSHFKVYVFSNGQYPYTEEFEEVLPHVELCALPDAIYKAYKHVLPKRNKKKLLALEDEASIDEQGTTMGQEIDLFNQSATTE